MDVQRGQVGGQVQIIKKNTRTHSLCHVIFSCFLVLFRCCVGVLVIVRVTRHTTHDAQALF